MTSGKILVGYRVGTGEPIFMPPKHTMIVGLTGDSGKTTAVLGIASRWPGQKFVVFKTKIGEDVFDGYPTIPPYYREQKATWKSVEALIEASLGGEKINIIRTTLMKVCQGANTIEEVFKKVSKQLADMDSKGKSGFAYDMLFQVRQYLDDVLEELKKYKFSDKLELREGVNVVDLTEMAQSDNGAVMLAMMVGATADNILKHHKKTSLVVPEGWQVIPSDRKTPAHAPVEALIRLGRVQENFVVIDSQDIAGIHAKIRRNVPNALIGKQSTMDDNEVERARRAIPLPANKKPTIEQLQTLRKGQFYALLNEEVNLIYARPAWMSEDDAIRAAKGAPIATALTAPANSNQGKANVTRIEKEVHPKVPDKLENQRIEKLQEDLDKAYKFIEQLTEIQGKREDEIRTEKERADSLLKQRDALEFSRKQMADFLWPVYKDYLDAMPVKTLPGIVTQAAITNSDGEIDVNAEDVQVNVVEKTRMEKFDESTHEGRLAILIVDGFFNEPRLLQAVKNEVSRLWGVSWGSNSTDALKRALAKFSQRPYVLLTINESEKFVVTEKGRGVRKEHIVDEKTRQDD